MGQDATEVLVAARGNINLAPTGTTLPAPGDLDPLDDAFVDLGFTTEEGTSVTYAEARQEIMAWQSPTAIRRIVTGRDLTTAYSLEQYNRSTFELAFGGGEWTEPEVGHFTYTPPDADDPLAEWSQVVDFFDGDKHGRLVIPKGGVNEDVQTSLVRTAASLLPVAFKALDAGDLADSNWYFTTDDPAFAVGS